MNDEKPGTPPIVTIQGDLVALGPQRRDLVTRYQQWLNDFAILASVGMLLRPLHEQGEVALFEETSAHPTQAWFTVYVRSSMQPIGIAGLRDIDHVRRTAEYVIFIGEQLAWGKGYGTETTQLVLDYGFTALGLHNIMLQVFSFNERAIAVYRRVGFRELGRRREAYRLSGRVYDAIFMDYLASEFESPVLGKLIPL